MIDELKILHGIVGDLSAMGGWVFVGYILYSLAKTILTFVASLWLIYKIVIMAFAHFRAPYTKEECKQLEKERDDALRSKQDIQQQADRDVRSANKEAEIEVQDIKHKFKIMKESLSAELKKVREDYESKSSRAPEAVSDHSNATSDA